MILPFTSFDPAPVVSSKEEAAYKKGYHEGVEAGRKEMGLYLPCMVDALKNLECYRVDYRKKLNHHMIQAFEHMLKQLVMPLPVCNKIVKSRVRELIEQLDKHLAFTITVADPTTLEGHMPEGVVLNADPALPETDFTLMWGSNQITVYACQEELNQRLMTWFAQTLELMTQGEIIHE